LERFFVRTARAGPLWMTLQRDDGPAGEILARHFPEAERRAGGSGGLASFLLAENDGTVAENMVRQGVVNDRRRLRYLHRARWVEIGNKAIYAWHGGREIMIHQIDELFLVTLRLKEEHPTLQDIRRAIASEIDRRKRGIPFGEVRVVRKPEGDDEPTR
jgi:hypothetical protein